MDNSTHLISRSPYSWESGFFPSPVGVAIDPDLAAGILLGYCLLGLGSYIWAFWSQQNGFFYFINSFASFWCSTSRPRGVQHIHTYLRQLILMDATNAVTSVILAVEFIGYSCRSIDICFTSFHVWYVIRYFGVFFNVFSALGCLFLLYHPQQGSRFFWIFKLFVVFLLIFCLILFFTISYKAATFVAGALVFALTLIIIVKYAVSAAPPSANMHIKPIVTVATFTVFFAFAPTFVLYCLLNSSTSSGESDDPYLTAYAYVLFFTNVNVFMDGLLCYFILRMPFEEEQLEEVSLDS